MTPPGRRRHPRLRVPAFVLSPTIPDSPMETEDISAGGFKASFTELPDAQSLHEAVILLPGATFSACRTRVTWWAERKNGNSAHHPWAGGLAFLMEEREQDRLMRAIESLAKGGEHE